MNRNSLFDEFLGDEVKAPYRDGSQFKIARGVLESIDSGFVKIRGRLGTIIINEKNIEKMSRLSRRDDL
ncbi:hypothetical protein HY640_00455 [Candidatus Woesearchaeota archaeon]|nr:hypothetical protein [Candidatus Woesearchaeota archaeon]